MTSFTPNVAAITLFIEDRERSKAFYARAFDAKPIFEDDNSVVFRLDNLLLNLLARSAATELIEPAATAAPGSGSQFQFTIDVDDTDAACAALEARGIALLNGPMNRPWGVRTAAFADPDGHVWEVGSNIPKS
jgi:catechol 2,3-dioxygenase-like lactoylglutathione lyase family enzyme